MANEVVKEEVPANAPWKVGWQEVAKASGVEVPETPAPTLMDKVKATVKPWLEDWGVISRVSEQQADKQKPVKVDEKKTPTKGFDLRNYITKLEKTESSGNPEAKAKTSSALGLHQFTSTTWMEMVNKLNLPYNLSDRKDPEKSRKVVEAFTEKNVEKAQEDLGRPPNMVEAYMYHFVGRSAPKLLQAPPEAPATAYVTPTQAKANKSVFFHKGGKPKTVGEVLARYEERFK